MKANDIWVVGNVTQNNSLSGDFSSIANYSYFYFGGKYDYKEQEFRGFNIVNETRPDNSIVSHYFHQDYALKGKEYKTEIYNSSKALYSKTENNYNYTGSFLSTLSDRFTVYLLELLDFQVLEENASSTISEIIARSNSGNQTISWQLDTGDGIISSEEPISLNESEQVFIIIEHTYPSGYVYSTNASVNSSIYQDQEQGVAVIP